MFGAILKGIFGGKPDVDNTDKIDPELTDKEYADQQGLSYIDVINVEVDPDNPTAGGSFEFDWNDAFIVRLAKSGYEAKTDAEMVDHWFQDVCRQIAMENFEKDEAMNPDIEPSGRRKIGNGRTEVT
jgi:hypothetical protein